MADEHSSSPDGPRLFEGHVRPAASSSWRGWLEEALRLLGPSLLTAALLAFGGCVSPHTPASSKIADLALADSGSPPAIAIEPAPSATNSGTGSGSGVAGAGSASPALELPRGGRAIFPDYRLVGFCGTPGAPALGELQGNLKVKAKALEAQASHYVQASQGRKLLPVFELIAVVVQSSPGSDGKYRRRVDPSVVDDYLRAARQSKALLLLNIQPGQSDFMSEVKVFEQYLREPDVGIALDPEWAMKPKQRPGVFYGQTTGATVNDVAAYLSHLVTIGNLPEKALVYHEVIRDVVKDETTVRTFPGVALIKSVDGLGPVHAKINTYDNLMEVISAGVHPGFKLFFDEDSRNGSRLMTAKEVLALMPQPEYVMYE